MITALWEAHPMLLTLAAIFVMVLLLGILLPITVYLCSRFIQWHMKKHPELVLRETEADREYSPYHDSVYVDNKGEEGFRDK